VITIPYVKAHGARNDFLLTWRQEAPGAERDFCAAARAICERHTGAGADGWILLEEAGEADAAIELWNSDGSRSEISGNGTRCAAALLIESGRADAEVRILTGAGVKRLKLIERRGPVSVLEMNMGRARVEEPRSDIVEGREAVIVNVGNPQCAVFVADFDFDWRALGAELERHPRFPERTNVSFVRVVDRHTLEVRFFERGAGPTLSSGTGSTGAAAAARSRGLIDPGSAERPVRVETLAGPLELRWEGDDILLSGPAEIVARGVFFWNAE
jgi:diaminopimelate epimerase